MEKSEKYEDYAYQIRVEELMIRGFAAGAFIAVAGTTIARYLGNPLDLAGTLAVVLAGAFAGCAVGGIGGSMEWLK